jgi:poly-gamma-glutamate synthesis protein (capsule biosynthesis protein)
MYPNEIRFCSDPAYDALLEEVGADVIELTGDHFGDYGVEAMQETLRIYQAKDMPYYGGGANTAEARQAVILEHHGNRIAFIGCNAKGIDYYASATDTSPGAVACDLDWMSAEVARLKAEGYLVIATFQHIEYDAYDPDPLLKQDLQRIARAGAAIVSGSQAHQPHGMSFLGDSFIHYGLGNLFFDQYRYYPGGELDYGFIDWHIFYAGKHISTRLVTISWVDLAKNRFTTPTEREKFLQTIFNVSQWEVSEPAQP